MSTAELTGTFKHALDAKGRLTLPKEIREALGEGAWMGPGNDGCLTIWPAEGWNEVAERVRAMRGSREERNVARTFFMQSGRVEPDAQGRIAIPQTLRESMAIEKEVVVIGAWDCVEIWSSERFSLMADEGRTAIAAGRVSAL